MSDTLPPDSSDTGRAARLRALFDTAVDQPTAIRADWIDAHVTDPDDRAALRRLIEADDRDGLLECPADERMQRLDAAESPAAAAWVGQRIGAFRLTRLIGEGGMAVVFHGERDGGEFRQQVAVKLLRRGLWSPLEQRLFRREQQALASLSHPNITHLIDGGVTGDGVPYLILEYVHGVPITEHAATHGCSLRERLALFVVVCRAVAAAHRQLIVHRDLKPANILVDTEGQVKLLDFGIAKLLGDDRDAARTEMTVLTPGYAAPEQLAGGTVTTATDVYALGVVLHELLLGERPPAASMDHYVPARGDARPAAPAARTTPMIGRDLDNVLRKALSGEPERRYDSASEFADDVERYLSERPVLAHPPSRWYRTRKFMRRHRGGVAITGVLVVATLASLVAALVQAHLARQEAQRANAFRGFLVSAFREAQPGTPREGAPRITAVVDEAARRAEGDASLPPGVRVELLTELGAVLRAQGDAKRAVEVLRANHARAQREFGPDDPIVARAGVVLLDALHAADDLPAARALADTLARELPASALAQRSTVLVTSSILALLERQMDRAIADSEQGLAIARMQPDPEILAAALSQRLAAFGDNGRLAEAVAAGEEALAVQRAAFGDDHVKAADARANLSRMQRRMGDLDAAEANIREALVITERAFPPEHPTRSIHLNALLMILTERRDFPAAIEVAREAARIMKAAYGDNDRRSIQALSNVGVVALSAQDPAGAVAPLAEATRLAEANLAPGQGTGVSARAYHGVALAYVGDIAAGRAELQRALDAVRAAPSPDRGTEATFCLEQAHIELDLGRPAAARAPLACVHEALSRVDKPERWWTGRADLLHARIALESGAVAESRAHLEAAEAALAANRSYGPDIPVYVALLRVGVAAAEGDHERASDLEKQARAAYAALAYPPRYVRRLFEFLRLDAKP